jgi:hypothetical protein
MACLQAILVVCGVLAARVSDYMASRADRCGSDIGPTYRLLGYPGVGC